MTEAAVLPPTLTTAESRRSPRQLVRRWLAPVLVVVVAAFTRLWRLGDPHSLIYDEHFYVKDAYSMLTLGYPGTWPKHADAAFDAGNVNIFTATAEPIAHPPLGRWIIAIGIKVFGVQDATGWRIMDAVAGILAVILVIAIARRLFHSLAFGTIAGGLLAIDGSAIVMSRVGLLDNFLMLFALVGFGATLLDRDWAARRLRRWRLEAGDSAAAMRWGPISWWRPWLILAGIAFGAASSVKISGFVFLVAFAVYSVVTDALGRRAAGVTLWHVGMLRQGAANLVLTIPVGIVVYLASWIGWFATPGGFFRQWANLPGHAATGLFAWLPRTVQSFWHLQVYLYEFGSSFDAKDAYSSPPLDWPLLIRPIAMYFDYKGVGEGGCTVRSCTATINAISNPIIWWAGTAAILVLVFMLMFRRRWPVGFILMGVLAGYVPWLLVSRPTVFQFYTIVWEPYLVLALTFVLQLCWISRASTERRRRAARIGVVVFLAVAVGISIYYFPLWVGLLEPTPFIEAHYWLPSWS